MKQKIADKIIPAALLLGLFGTFLLNMTNSNDEPPLGKFYHYNVPMMAGSFLASLITSLISERLDRDKGGLAQSLDANSALFFGAFLGSLACMALAIVKTISTGNINMYSMK